MTRYTDVWIVLAWEDGDYTVHSVHKTERGAMAEVNLQEGQPYRAASYDIEQHTLQP